MLRSFLDQIIKFLNTRIFVVGSIVLIQLIIVLSFVTHFGIANDHFKYFLYFLSIALVIKVVNRFSNTSYKLAWIIIILGLPLAGGIIYLLFAERKVPKKLRGKIIAELSKTKGFFDDKQIEITDYDTARIFDYIKNNGNFPYYNNTEVKYYKIGEEFFEDLLHYIAKAEKFIFIEFFIVKEGYMFERFFKALCEALERGVEIYFTYDDGGSITCLPEDFEKRLKEVGVHVVAFSPVSVYLSLLSRTNIRSHRKMIVIDNRYAFTGGYNLADEYINKVVRFGHWKDTGILLEGEAVWNFTIMYIQFYNASVKKGEELKYLDFKYEYAFKPNKTLVLPFSDSPTDDEDLGRTTHLSMINNAKKYIYIHTPYLILDYDMANALRIAAKSGVEVIITVPHIPDKKTVFMVTRSHYKPLLEAGVKIYEYTPGFLHSKLVVMDDKIALEGTFNMDYRSYYLNYECGVLVANSTEVLKMKEDYLNTLKVSKQVTKKDVEKVNVIVLVLRSILNVFAPLL